MKLRTLFFLFLVTTIALPAIAEEQAFLTAALYAADENAAASDEPYRAGRRALDSKNWSEAIELFARSAGSASEHADAAHYWWAYALNKDGRSKDALKILGQLRRDYADSPWLDDASALQLEIRGGGEGSERDDNQELKLLALNSLMHSDSERALPMLKRFLAGDHSRELRERALFVVSQSGSDESKEILLAVARGDQHPELQERAIHYLGMSNVPGASSALEELYRSSADKELKKRVLHGFMLANAAQPLLELAQNEPDEELRLASIHQLGVMGATGSLKQLYEAESSTQVKKRILHALFIANDSEFLADVARRESDTELRHSAIRSLGMTGSEAGARALVEIYDQASDATTKEKVIEALFLNDEAEELIRIARNETDPRLRRSAIHRLSLMGNEAALEFMIEILEQ